MVMQKTTPTGMERHFSDGTITLGDMSLGPHGFQIASFVHKDDTIESIESEIPNILHPELKKKTSKAKAVAKPVAKAVGAKKYLILYYKKNHSVAIRQNWGQKKQLKPCKGGKAKEAFMRKTAADAIDMILGGSTEADAIAYLHSQIEA